MTRATVIYHMTTRNAWEATPPDRPFMAATLASEGFVHFTAEPERLLQVANRFYRSEPGDWVILTVDPACLTAPLRWEPADGHVFPHVYGPVDRAAILDITPFPRRNAEFVLPQAMGERRS